MKTCQKALTIKVRHILPNLLRNIHRHLNIHNLPIWLHGKLILNSFCLCSPIYNSPVSPGLCFFACVYLGMKCCSCIESPVRQSKRATEELKLLQSRKEHRRLWMSDCRRPWFPQWLQILHLTHSKHKMTCRLLQDTTFCCTMDFL